MEILLRWFSFESVPSNFTNVLTAVYELTNQGVNTYKVCDSIRLMKSQKGEFANGLARLVENILNLPTAQFTTHEVHGHPNIHGIPSRKYELDNIISIL